MPVEAVLGKMKIGDDHPVRLMGAINVSPESFYKGSIRIGREEIMQAALRMEKEGAEIIDIGAMSTAPYLKTEITVEEETKRLSNAVIAIKEQVKLPVSADTMRSAPAQAAFKAGAEILNDVSGLKNDPQLPRLASECGAGLILMAHESKPVEGTPIERVRNHLSESLEIASKHNIEPSRIILDPGIGFFRKSPWPWYVWDAQILLNLSELRTLGRPLNVAVSHKSFIGEVLHQPEPSDRLYGSLAAETIAVMNGAHIIRTHEIAPTLQAVRLAEFIRSLAAKPHSQRRFN